MLKPVLVQKAVLPVLTLAEAKAHLRVDFADDDDLITALIASATSYLDGYAGILGRALLTQTWAVKAASFAVPCIRLPLVPVQSATVSYVASDGTVTVLAGSVWQVLEDAMGPFLALKHGQVWPSVRAQADAVTVEFVCGHVSAAEIPEAIRHAHKMLVAHWYDKREAAGEASAEVPYGVTALLAPFQRVGV